MDGITFTRGLDEDGSGLYLHQATASIKHCSFINNGTTSGSEYEGGGLSATGSYVEIYGCLFEENKTGDKGRGGAIYAEGSPVSIAETTFTGNTSGWGGAVKLLGSNNDLQHRFLDCVFTDNLASWDGGGLDISHTSALVENCQFLRNEAKDSGGGIWNWYGDLEMYNSVFSRNTALEGGGLANEFDATSSVIHCTFANNNAQFEGGGGVYIGYNGVTIRNSILWNNTWDQISGECDATYCCIKDGYTGEGNIDVDPLFWNVANDPLRLHAPSPCINSATTEGATQQDIRGVSRPNGAGVDMGAYEMVAVDTDRDGLIDEFEEMYSNTNPNLEDTNGNGTNDWDEWFNTTQRLYVDQSCKAQSPTGMSWESALTDLQSAIDTAGSLGGAEVWVSRGTYTGEGTCALTLYPNVHLYGGFCGNETEKNKRNRIKHPTIIDGESARRCVHGAENAALDSFTITRGMAPHAAGMYIRDDSCTVSNCIFTNNQAEVGAAGLALYRTQSTISNCLFFNNILTDAFGRGGGIYGSEGSYTITNCTFSQNTAHYTGGGLAVFSEDGTISNCISWNNSIPDQIRENTISYSCIEDGVLGEGNIDADPYFVDPENGDFSLRLNSPCVNTGTTDNAPNIDLYARPRPQGAGIDMGAIEAGGGVFFSN